METTEKKKHKGGYELLKEKYAALEKERDEWKSESEYNKKELEYFTNLFKKECDDCTDKDLRIAFLLDNCPFWVRWKYRKQFEKGGN